MAEFTKVGLVFHPITKEIIRTVYPVEGDHELDDMSQFLFYLDPTVDWQAMVVDRDDPRASFSFGNVS